MLPELLALFEADRQDHRHIRMAGTPEYDAMRARDADRRERARVLLATSPDLDPADLYHAAWLLNHGETPEDAEQAFRLAERASAGGHLEARWLSAASYDRWCMYRGLPQRFGTQIVPDGVGYRVWDVDGTASDEERAALGVPPLADQLRRAAEQGRTLPQPPWDRAPAWLRSALSRWAGETT
jgi:TPR repeat protein